MNNCYTQLAQLASGNFKGPISHLVKRTFFTLSKMYYCRHRHQPHPPNCIPNSDTALLAPLRPATPVVVEGFNSFCSACAENTDTNKEGVGEEGRSLRHSGRVARTLPFWARAAAVKAGTGVISIPAPATPTTVRVDLQARAGGLRELAPSPDTAPAPQRRLVSTRSAPLRHLGNADFSPL